MCGIVGYTGTRPARDILIEGLRRLEYRGYDSAGIAAAGCVRVRVALAGAAVRGPARVADAARAR